MTPPDLFRAPVLVMALALVFLPACENAIEPVVLADEDHVRDTPHSTVTGALAALDAGDYGKFPALVGLALTLKPHAARNPEGIGPLLQEADFEKVREILRAAQTTTPTITEAGRVAAYSLPGHGLFRDELHLIRHRDQWFFIVD